MARGTPGRSGFGGGTGDREGQFSAGGGAGLGGAIFADGSTVTVLRSTLTGNTATGGSGGGGSGTASGSGLGGAIFSRNGTVTVRDSTISGNAADQGRGVFVASDGATATLSVARSILGAAGDSAADVAAAALPGSPAPLVAGSANVVSNPGGLDVGAAATGDPRLGPLSANGGPTRTLAPLPGSPAINLGDLAVSDLPAFDQRGPGFRRVADRAPDAGAVEFCADTFPLLSLTATAADAVEGGAGTLTLTRTGDLSAPLGVRPLVSGTASATDWSIVSVAGGSHDAATGTFTFAAGSSAMRFDIAALADGDAAQASETVTLALDPAQAGFDLGNPTAGTVAIAANGLLVTTTADAGTGSLRQAVANANAFATADAITFDTAGLFGMQQTIPLGSTLVLTDAARTTITGSAAGVVISGGGAVRVFDIVAGASATLAGLTIRDGRGDTGGGVRNAGTLALSGVAVLGNASTLGQGGGVDNGGTLTITASTFAGNTSGVLGGGLFNSGTAAIEGSTFRGNAGGIHTAQAVIETGAGALLVDIGKLSLTGSIVAGNTKSDLSGGALDPASGFNLVGGDPLLSPLGDYGGPTRTFALLPGSPALDAGTGTGTDQRGVGPVGRRDIGAFESRGFTFTIVGGNGQSAPAGSPFGEPLAVAVASVEGTPVDGGTVTFTPPASGPGLAEATPRRVTIAGGTASLGVTANAVASTFAVAAADVSFSLTTVTLPQAVAFELPAGATYGDGPLTLSATGGESDNPVTFRVVSGLGTLSGNVLTITCAGAVVLEATQAGDATFADAEPVTRSLAVAPAVLTVRASDATRTAGGVDPAFGFTLAGFVNGDTAAVVTGTAALSTTATASSPPGAYPIAATRGSLSAANYVFAFEPGTLTMSAAPVTPTPVLPPVTPPARRSPDQTRVGPFAVSSSTGGLVTVYDARGSALYAVTAFAGAALPGGVRVAVADVTGDGTPDVVAGTGPGVRGRVQVIDEATRAVVRQWDAFEASFTGGTFVAAADFNGDGFADVIVTPDVTGGPRVSVSSGATGAVLADFFGIDDPAFRGGARAAAGDIDGDGTADLIVAAGRKGGPRVAAFDGNTLGRVPEKLFADRFVFEPALRDGVFVTAGDLDGDGRAELVAGGGQRVLALSGADLLAGRARAVADFLAGDAGSRAGARVVVKAGDAGAELVVAAADGAGDGAGDAVRGFGDGAGDEPDAAFTLGLAAGVFVG